MKISGLLPIYNGAKYIDIALKRILSNLEENDELVIVNNGSTDGSRQKLEQWVKQDKRINLVDLKTPGLVKALKLGMNECQNNWIARFDIDDIYSLDRIKIQREQINESTVAIFSDYQFISNTGVNLGNIPSPIFPPFVSLSLVLSQRTAHPSVIFLKDAVNSVGGYRENDFPAEDLSLWLRLSRSGNLKSIPKTLLQYRLAESSISLNNRATIMEKTANLHREIGIYGNHLNDLLENFELYLAKYEKFSHSSIRKLLTLRELSRLQKTPYRLTFSQKKHIMRIIKNKTFLELLNLGSYHDIYEMISMQSKRKKYRTHHSSIKEKRDK